MAFYKEYRYKTYQLSSSLVVVRVFTKYGKKARWKFGINGFLNQVERKAQIEDAIDTLIALAR